MAEHETQKSIAAWAKATFPGGNDRSHVHPLRLLEEAVELCRATGANRIEIASTVNRIMGKFTDPYRDPEPAKVPAEIADVAILLDVLADRWEVDLQAEKNAKMKINRARIWICHGDGTGHHVPTPRTPWAPQRLGHVTCACRSPGARECLEDRYLGRGLDLSDRCECCCHEPDEPGDDGEA